MDLPILAAAVIGLAAASLSDVPTGGVLQSSSTQASKVQGPDALVGQALWASDAPVEPWADTVRARDLPLEALGTVTRIGTSPDGEAESLVVAVGGLWGWGAQEVEMSWERVHLVRGADGRDQLVVDLSSSGAEPPIDGMDL